MDELGIQGLSTKEIAIRQGVAESALYRHFRSKDEILLHILEYFSQFDQSIAATVQESHGTARDTLLRLGQMHAEYYENYPAITAVCFYYTSFLNNPPTAQLSLEIHRRRVACFQQLVQHGQEQGEFSSVFSSEELGDVLYAYFMFAINKWRIEQYTFSLKQSVLTTFKKILGV